MSDTRKRRSGGSSKSLRQDSGDHSKHGSIKVNSNKASNGKHQQGKNLKSHSGHNKSYDSIRKIVQEEGRTARNLVQYSVPLLESQGDGPVVPRLPLNAKRTGSSSRSNSHRTPPPGSRFRHRSLSNMTKSPRSEFDTKNDLRARYWKYMFDNFQRAVDSIYQTCEQDESVLECKEVIMMLEQSKRFQGFD